MPVLKRSRVFKKALRRKIFNSLFMVYLSDVAKLFKEHFKPLIRFFYKYAIFPIYKYVLRAPYSKVFIPIYNDVYKFTMKMYLNWGGSYVDRYLARRAWNKTSWKQRWLTRIRREARYTDWKYRHHQVFDTFINKLGWFKHLLPVNYLRKIYLWSKDKEATQKIRKNDAIIASKREEA